ncbi:MAG: DUF2520 domain-containing protein [Alphaproteobacteria bacterium]|nr:MAG: DUF2520 domain-containing protein [Alphaproteobacteria bacterium]
MKSKKQIVIIGNGKLGGVLRTALHKAGFNVRAFGRGQKPDVGDADIVFIATQDQNIAKTAKSLARLEWKKGAVAVHCSGSENSDLLSPLRRKGVFTASCHPLQSFPNLKSGLRALPGTYWFCEGRGRALATMKPIIQKLRGKMVTVKPDQKNAYHGAVCMAANYLTTLVGASGDIAAQIGLRESEFRAALAPILHATLRNTIAIGPRAALTGPIQRGDGVTVQKHQRAIKKLRNNSRDLLGVYNALYKYTKVMIDN